MKKRTSTPANLALTLARRAPLHAALLLSVALTGSVAFAANPYLGAPTLREYNLTQVITAAGLIDVAQGDVVTVQMPQEIGSYVLARQEAFHVELDGDVAYISALTSNGRSTIIFRLKDGVIVRFALNATKTGTVGKGIIVNDDRAAGSYAKSSPVTARAAASPDAAPLTASSPLLAPAGSDTSSAAGSALDAALQKLKAYATKTVSATVSIRPATREVEVIFTNTGKTDVSLLGTDAHLYVDDVPAAVSAPNVTVKPGMTSRVLLRLSQEISAEQKLRLSWMSSDGVRMTLVDVNE